MQPEEKQIPVGEFQVNYAAAGNGESLLLLHGSEPMETWRVWEPMLSLSDRHKLIMPDLLGHGQSSKPIETPDYTVQAHAMKDLLEKLGVSKIGLIGAGWGGQVALEMAMAWRDAVRAIVLISSSYDKDQLRRLEKMRRPTLIIYAEDDMVTQLKAGYMLRDAIGTSRLEVLDAVSKDPSQDFRMSHRLQKFRGPQVLQLVKTFLSSPEQMIAEPPELENELKGMALRKDDEKYGQKPSGSP